MSYQVSEKGLAIIENFEGLVLHPYLDQVGIPTIGYGTTFYPGGKKVSINDPAINRDQAISYLKNFVDTVIIPTLNKYIKVELNQNQVDALASFVYNLGSGALAGSHLLQVVNAKGTCGQVTAEFDKWVYANHKVLQDLVERRAQEAALFCK